MPWLQELPQGGPLWVAELGKASACVEQRGQSCCQAAGCVPELTWSGLRQPPKPLCASSQHTMVWLGSLQGPSAL